MKCLVVEDDEALGLTLRNSLEGQGHTVHSVTSVAEGFKALRRARFDLLLLDYRLPDGDSLPLSDYAAATCPNLRIILLTGSGIFPRGEVKQIAPGIDWVLRKPVPLGDLAAIVDYAAQDAKRCPVGCTGCA